MILTHMIMFSFFQSNDAATNLLSIYAGTGMQRGLTSGLNRGAV